MFDNIRADIEAARLERKSSLNANTGFKVFVGRVQAGCRLLTVCIMAYRFTKWAQKVRIPVVRQILLLIGMVWRRSMAILMGVHLSPEANIGPGLVIHTPIGIYVGGTKIGKNLTVQTGVLIAAGAGEIGDNVYFGPGAKIVGNAKIGSNVVIMANSLVLTDVPSNCTVVGVPARIRLPGGRPRRFWKGQEVGHSAPKAVTRA